MVDQSCPYIFRKRGVFYYTRRVPSDLFNFYNTDRIVLSLRTSSFRVAQKQSSALSLKLEDDWFNLRRQMYSNDLLQRFMKSDNQRKETQSDAPLFSEAKDIYLKAKGIGRPRTFETAIERAFKNVKMVLGDKPIDTYTRSEANRLRDAYAKRGLSKATIHRAFNVIRAILNFVSREHDLPEIRTFSGVFLGDDIINAPQKRIPIPTTTILKVQKLCQKENDEITRLVALISDTGMRLSEAAGLLKTDIHVDQKHPYIYLKPHKWRRLKTSDSERVIPLVGVSLWAASTAYENTSNDFLFPKFCNAYECKGGVASTTLNKWMSQHVPKGCVIHSFRHSLRDRLRAVQCPPDIIDRIGGWTVGGVGEGYGSGYPVDVLHKWMLTMIKNKKDVPHRTLKTL